MCECDDNSSLSFTYQTRAMYLITHYSSHLYLHNLRLAIFVKHTAWACDSRLPVVMVHTHTPLCQIEHTLGYVQISRNLYTCKCTATCQESIAVFLLWQRWHEHGRRSKRVCSVFAYLKIKNALYRIRTFSLRANFSVILRIGKDFLESLLRALRPPRFGSLYPEKWAD